MSFEVRPIAPSDAPALLDILEEARQFKVTAGDLRWGLEPHTMEETVRICATDDTYIALHEGHAAGTLRLSDSDEAIWGEQLGNDGQALYIHRLAVADSFRRQGVGKNMIAWACQKVIDNGRSQLRLDSPVENDRLCRYYHRQLFWEVGVSRQPDRINVLLQRRV